MTYPLPAVQELTAVQQDIVHAPLDNESTVGGVAGSGKTVAAIHHLAYLCAQTSRRSNESTVLFLCFNRALAASVRASLLQMPPSISSRIEVRTVHQWSFRHYIQNQYHDFTV